MKRYMGAWLAVALCVALVGGSALAEGLDALPVELELEEAALSDAPAIEDDMLDLSLDIDPLDFDPLDMDLPEQSPEGLQADGIESNETTQNRRTIKNCITYEIADGEATVIAADKIIAEAKIVDTIKGYPVRHIAAGAFSGCKKLWTVDVPASVTDIGERAFADCKALVFVTLPESITSIGAYAFENDSMISHFVLPEGLTEISEGLFENCQLMWKISLPSTLQVIGDNAFHGCLLLKEFTLPEGLRQIGVSAFEQCEAMRYLTIPTSLSVIPEYAFKDCKDLRRLTLQSGLTAIETSAFQNCNKLGKISLPSTLQEIGRFAFAYCEHVETLTIPGQVNSVGYGAFFHCVDLEGIAVKQGVSEIGPYAFAQCKKLLNVKIPESVQTMGNDVFTVGKSAKINDVGEVELVVPLSQPRKLNLYGRPDSTASEYAEEYGIPFVVQKILATSVSIAEGSKLTLYVGHPMQLTAVMEPADAEMKLTWSSDSSRVKVSSDGLLTPRREGKATVTVKTENGKKAKVAVTVIDAKSVRILEGKSATMQVGEKLQLNAQVLPEQVASKLTWSSGSRKIATVSNTGLVKALKKGTVTIYVKTGNGKKAKIKIKVTEPTM